MQSSKKPGFTQGAAIFFLLGSFLSACGNGESTEADAVEGDTATVSAITQTDAAFVDSMIPHHEEAIQLSDIAIERGSRVEVMALARKIRDSSMVEIQEMQTARQGSAGSAEGATGPAGEASREPSGEFAAGDTAGVDHDMPAPGPATSTDPSIQAVIDSMQTEEGAAVDSLYLTHMIRHHQKGIAMAEEAQPGLQNPQLQSISRKIIESQPAEVEEMNRLLEEQ